MNSAIRLGERQAQIHGRDTGLLGDGPQRHRDTEDHHARWTSCVVDGTNHWMRDGSHRHLGPGSARIDLRIGTVL